MQTVREPAVAGTFYPDAPATLRAEIDRCLNAGVAMAKGAHLDAGKDKEEAKSQPKVIIAPHAGYQYSGAVAGQVYRRLTASRHDIKRVVLLGPAHRLAFRGMAVPTSTSFRTPLGDIPVASEAIAGIIGRSNVGFLDQAFEGEHSLEVHLPFLQTLLQTFDLIPIVVGDAKKDEVADVINRLWAGPETLIIVSTDLSHFEDYARASSHDARTVQRIVSLDATLAGEDACGCRAVNGLLHCLRQKDLSIEGVDVRNSGDTAGSKERVVGYGSFVVNEAAAAKPAQEWPLAQRQAMLQLARETIRQTLEGHKQFNISLALYPRPLRQQRASFVTLNLNGKLRGCIGSLKAHRPLITDIASNAQSAAFRDPRFKPLTAEEYIAIELHLSILSEPAPLSVTRREDLIAALRPGIDGLIIKQGGAQATYLPSVWEQLPDPEQFVASLRVKAGLDAAGWRPDTQLFTYQTEAFS